MSRDHSPPAPNPEPPQQTGHVGVNDRKASRGDDYADDNNRSAEGNDASLTSGPSFDRQVHADGSVDAAPTADGQAADAQASAGRKDEPSPTHSPAGRGHRTPGAG